MNKPESTDSQPPKRRGDKPSAGTLAHQMDAAEREAGVRRQL